MKTLILLISTFIFSSSYAETLPASGTQKANKAHQEEVRRTIKSALPDIKTCYEEHLKKDSGAGGKIVMAFEINDQGQMMASKALQDKSKWQSNAGRGNESASMNEMASCISEKVKTLKFPVVNDMKTMTINYPFVFGSR